VDVHEQCGPDFFRPLLALALRVKKKIWSLFVVTFLVLFVWQTKRTKILPMAETSCFYKAFTCKQNPFVHFFCRHKRNEPKKKAG